MMINLFKFALKKLFIFLCLTFSTTVIAQELLLNPTPTVYELNTIIPEHICSFFDIDDMIEEDSINDLMGISPSRFAKGFDLNISTNNFGNWETIGNVHVWRYKITSTNAYSMNVLLDSINIPANASIFIYNEDMSYVVGPIQYNVNQYGIYHSEFIQGASIIIELAIEGNVQQEIPYFTITGVAHDYYDFFGYTFYNDGTAFANRIDNCINKDINCSIGDNWQTHKRSVALMVAKFPNWIGINKDVGYCTGALINNTSFDGRSLFLTANHCIDNDKLANKTIFYFNHESNGCDNKKEHPYNFVVSGATLRSNNEYTDFSLLELHSRIPSSYYPYFAGWDKGSSIAQSGVGIHHPKGNLKKIAIDNDNIIPNPVTRTYINPPISFPSGTLWDVYFDEGSVTRGSSGSPLFNENKKIIGQLSGTDIDPTNIKCPDRRLYGRLSVSWDYGPTPDTRLKEWLDPNNNNPSEILGFTPAGWRNDWLTGWNQPASHKMHTNIKSLAVGTGGQVFYRGEDNKMQVYYHDGTQWIHDWVRGWSIPSHEYIAGDVVVGSGNQLFYRGIDGKMHTYYWTVSGWQHDWLTGPFSPNTENVSAEQGSIAVSGNTVYYRGTDNKMHIYYYDALGWHHDWIVSGAPLTDNIGGDVVAGSGKQVFYKGIDGKTHEYWYHSTAGQYFHAVINPSAQPVSYIQGSMEVGQSNHIYYRGADNKMYVHYYDNALGIWQNGTFVSNPGNDQNASGNITSMPGTVMYRGADGKMHVYWYNSISNEWVHDWLENSWQAPSINNITGAIDAGTGGTVYYRGHDGLVRAYFWGNSAIHRPSNNDEELKNFAFIPNYQQKLTILAYPNPANDYVHINITSTEDDKYLLNLIDISGKIILSQEHQLNKGPNTLDLQLSNITYQGLFILSVQNLRTSEKVQTKLTKL